MVTPDSRVICTIAVRNDYLHLALFITSPLTKRDRGRTWLPMSHVYFIEDL